MTTAAPLDIAPLPANRDAWPPAAYGAGAPPEAYASYTKLRSGEWGLRVPNGCKPGDVVVARQKNGTERTERVRFVLWTGADTRTGVTISLATIDTGRVAPRPQPQPAARPTVTAPRPTAPTAATTRALQGRKPTVRSKRQAMPRIAAPRFLADGGCTKCGASTTTCDDVAECGFGRKCARNAAPGKAFTVCIGCGDHTPRSTPTLRATLDADRADAEATIGADEPLF